MVRQDMKRTVFVLGAGASAPYKFPLGTQLLRLVINCVIQPAPNLFTSYLGQRPDVMRAFGDALSKSGKMSVDAFLEHRPEFIEIGKLAIAYVLIRREMTGALFEPLEGAWMQYLFNCLNRPFDTFSNNLVSFITFNYDRSLEHYFFTCLQHSYGKTDKECAEQLNKIPIVHVHGTLGALPWQGRDDVRRFSSEVDPGTLQVAARNIKIIHDTIDGNDPEITTAKALLANAEQIYILGFGYDPTNMARIGLDSIPAGISHGSGHGLTEHERHLKMLSVNGRIHISNNDCLGMLRNVVQW